MDAIKQIIFGIALSQLPNEYRGEKSRFFHQGEDLFVCANPDHPAIRYDAEQRKWDPIIPDPFVFTKWR